MLILLNGHWYGSFHYSPNFHFGSSGSILAQSTWELFWTNWHQYSSSPCSFCPPYHYQSTNAVHSSSSTCFSYHQDKRVKPGNLWKYSFVHRTALDRNERPGLLKMCCTFYYSIGLQDCVLKQDYYGNEFADNLAKEATRNSDIWYNKIPKSEIVSGKREKAWKSGNNNGVTLLKDFQPKIFSRTLFWRRNYFFKF